MKLKSKISISNYEFKIENSNFSAEFRIRLVNQNFLILHTPSFEGCSDQKADH